jgi:hypothetical protein
MELAHAVERACLQKPDFKFLYDLRVTISINCFFHHFSSVSVTNRR